MAYTNDTTAANVVSYILFDWLKRHMEFNCQGDANKGLNPLFVNQPQPLPPPPLHVKSMEVICDRHYSLELRKEPIVFLMKELSVRWLPHLDATPPPDSFPTVLNNRDVDHPSGFYRVMSEVSEDYNYLVRLHITRV